MLRICSLLITIVAMVTPTPGLAETDFAHDVVPILKAHCVECHGGTKANGGFSLNTRALFLENEAAVPGDQDSLFLELINESDKDLQMPPEGKPRLTANEVKILQQWVEDDMPWEPGFTFGERNWEPPLSPRVVDLPPAHGNRNHPIDRILDAELAQRGLQPPALISDEAFLRRASLDAIGLLPTPEQLQVFTRRRILLHTAAFLRLPDLYLTL